MWYLLFLLMYFFFYFFKAMETFQRNGTLRRQKSNRSNDLGTIEERDDQIDDYCCHLRCLKMPRTVVDGPLPCGCWQWCICECLTQKHHKSWKGRYDNLVNFVQTKKVQLFGKK